MSHKVPQFVLAGSFAECLAAQDFAGSGIRSPPTSCFARFSPEASGR